MKNMLKAFCGIMVLVIIGFSVVTCGGGDNDGIPANLVGGWQKDGTQVFQVTSDGKFIMNSAIYDISVTGNTATLTFGGTPVGTFVYDISNNQMFILSNTATGIGITIAQFSPVKKSVSISNTKPENLSGNATHSQAIAKLDAIIAYSGTPPATKQQAEDLKAEMISLGPMWGTISSVYITMINNMINTIPEGTDNSQSITYTIEQYGGVNGTSTSTGIVFTFSAPVYNLQLMADDINVSGAAYKTPATIFTGTMTGTTWTYAPINVNAAGLAYVSIARGGIEPGVKTVLVYKQGQTAPEYWTINWVLNGGTAGTGLYPTQIVKGTVLAQPGSPTRSGYAFGGWYTNSGLTL